MLEAAATTGANNTRLNNDSVLSNSKADTHRSSEQMMEMLQTLHLPHVGAGFNAKRHASVPRSSVTAGNPLTMPTNPNK